MADTSAKVALVFLPLTKSFMATMKNIYVFGEIHRNRSNVNNITRQIQSLKPDYILHELLYADSCDSKETIAKRLKECKEGGVCDPNLNKDIYTLGMALDAKLVGIDLDDKNLNDLSIKAQFQKREAHMKRIIEKHLELEDNPTIVIVVGDTHLREQPSEELGLSSVLVALLKNHPRVDFKRAPVAIQEMT